jgi:phosphohistidine swiveling domain-containing protein
MPKYCLLNQDINTSFINIETTWTGMRSKLLKKQTGYLVPDSFVELLKGETLNYFQNEKQAKIFSQACANLVINNPKLLQEIKKQNWRLAEQIIKLAEEILPRLNKLSDLEIIKFLLLSRKLQAQFAAWGMAVAFSDIYGFISEAITKIFTKRKKLKYSISVYLENLSNPKELSLTEQAYQEISRVNLNSAKEISKLLKKYFWLDQGYIGRGLTLENLRDIKKNHAFYEKQIVPSELLKIELKLNSKEERLLAVSRDLVQIKSWRSDRRQAIYVIVNKIIDRLAKRFKIEAKYLETLSTKELIKAIKNRKNSPSDLKERFERSLFIPQSADDYQIVINEEKINSYLAERINRLAINKTKTIKGQTACPGKVRGRVRLVFGPQHNNKISEGDILVSVSTSPQLLPAMKKALAFITDMGGITSHAAIVSRELKKPCVVGTKIATQVLRDGDIVEVDANKGVINILN